MALAPFSGPIVGLQVAAEPPPSSSVKTILLARLLNVAECQNAKFSSSRTLAIVRGLSGSEMSNSTPSPMQAPAIRSLSGYEVRSSQPEVALVWPGHGVSGGSPGLPPSGNRTGSAATLAADRKSVV